MSAATWFGAEHALFGRIDRALYDAGLVLWRRPPPADIVAVVVDDDSIAALGRWPWRRAIHAALIEKLAVARPKAIAFDVIVSEPDAKDPGGDEALARAMAVAGNVILPSPVVEVTGVGARDILPIESLRDVAAAVAHIQVESDGDGVVRALNLLDGAQSPRPYLGLAALQVAGRAPRRIPGGPPRPGATQSHRYLIPFFGAGGTVPRFSYLSVLRGNVAPSEFKDRIVFVGTTAMGLGDDHQTPAGGRSAPMAGVEIAAQIAGALEEGAQIRAASPLQSAMVSSTLVLAILAFYRVLQPRTSLAVTAVAFVFALAGSLLALRVVQVWIPPSAAMFGLAISYPLWSWRRLEAALRYIRGELERLLDEPSAAPVTGKAGPPMPVATDLVNAAIAPLGAAIAGLRDARRFIADMVESVPQAIVVTDGTGKVLLANSRARDWLDSGAIEQLPEAGTGHAQPLEGRMLGQVLVAFNPAASRTWESIIDESLVADHVVQVDARGPRERQVLVLLSTFCSDRGERVGLIANIIDMSDKREAQRRREELLRVLSHDMRAPQASIITLLEMRTLDPTSIDTEMLIGRVAAFARRALSLADDFLRLARAEQARPDRFVELDLADVMAEACGEAWTLAHAGGIRIEQVFDVEEAPMLGDRSLLLRMVQNLLTNAILYSPRGTTVTVSLEARGVTWLLRVADQGRGIAKEDLPRLFARFGRVGVGKGDPGGVGLGLVIVRTVVERHHGVVSVLSEPGRGSTFSVSLPALRQAGTA